MVLSVSVTVSSSFASGTTALTMPICSAVFASSSGIAYTIQASALRVTLGISAEIASVGGRLCVISGNLNVALSAAMVTSQAVAMAQPKPSAAPCTAHTVGCGASLSAA